MATQGYGECHEELASIWSCVPTFAVGWPLAKVAANREAVGALAEYVEVRDVDHGYDIMTDETELIRGMYEVITAHVRRAIS
jgi:hypothetical protein